MNSDIEADVYMILCNHLDAAYGHYEPTRTTSPQARERANWLLAALEEGDYEIVKIPNG